MTGYKELARRARIGVLDMIYAAQSSHISSNFSSIDLLAVLFERMNLKTDKFIASKGWAAAAVYYFLAQKGVIPAKDLERYCQPGEEEYIGLVEPRGKFGLQAAGGAVGYGLSFGTGFALSKQLKGEEGTVYVLMSDGEQQVGMVWESALVAAHHGLKNLVAIIDNNKIQATGKTADVLNIEPLQKKWKAFGWEVSEINGHNHGAIVKALNRGRTKPLVIIANTIKGKGVQEFEQNGLQWHYKNIPEDVYKRAMEELCI